MKYVVILGDGMADEPIESLGGKTPLEYANTPNMDMLSKKSEVGLCHTIPEGMKPGSDTANLSVLGYDPKKYYSGRSPLEALSIGVPMKDTDIALRMNIVSITDDPDKSFEEQTIVDHSSSEISTEDCAVLVEALKEKLQSEKFQFYVGTSYRHCLIWNEGRVIDLVQPHDVLGTTIGQHLPKEQAFLDMMKISFGLLKDHPINIERKKQGLNPANCAWFWGAGTKPMLSSFEEKTGHKGMMVSAVDLLKGIGVGASMGVAKVEGATGGLHTNYAGKVKAALDALDNGYDFSYIHVEAPDEMGHQGSVEKKVKAIELLDSEVIGPVYETLKNKGEDFRILVMPDHPTPIRVRTHTANPVPYMIYDSTNELEKTWNYNEKEAKEGGIYEPVGHHLMDTFLSK
ncbi:MAG: cofactor-independent phosphoglycerate mutase [Lachnospiraceae bacterium]|nr:cofactor-independent phosphoglycerate mutase [Lachnospiraceae bacterium]